MHTKKKKNVWGGNLINQRRLLTKTSWHDAEKETPGALATDLGARRACLCVVWVKYIDLVSPELDHAKGIKGGGTESLIS